MDQPIEISIDQQRKSFKQHIEDETNKRILFSGPFGSGKTYFLKKFFEKEDGYNPFFIYPVNYSVSQNEDIFELLKFDIFFELLRLDITLPKEEEKLPWIFRQYSLLNKSSELILDVIRNSSKVGKNVVSVSEKLVEIENTLNRKKSSHKSEKDEIIQFLTAATKEKGTICEDDNSTALIRTLLDQLKQEEKKPVLIIDDLDRIDPDHIFRLFNVFAAHLDKNEEENKFGFDKIIFVCDFNNIRNLFRAKYSPQVDFSGYMAKFYNADVYYFENKASIEKQLTDLLYKVNLSEANLFNFFSINNDSSFIHGEIHYILTGLIRCGSTSLRELLKMERYIYPFQHYRLYSFTGFDLHNSDLRLLMILDFLSWVLGTGEILLEKIQRASESLVYQSIKDSGDSNNKYKLGSCVTILSLEKNYENQDKPHQHYFLPDGPEVSYSIQRVGQRRSGLLAEIQNSEELATVNYFRVLHQTVKKLQDFQLLK